MVFGRLSFTTETASARIIDGIESSMRGYNTRGDAGRCCTKAPYYASNERAGEGGLEVGDRSRWRDEIQMLCATQ